jgi:hypothetical protein
MALGEIGNICARLESWSLAHRYPRARGTLDFLSGADWLGAGSGSEFSIPVLLRQGEVFSSRSNRFAF